MDAQVLDHIVRLPTIRDVPAWEACHPSEPSRKPWLADFINDLLDLQSTLSANSMVLQKTTNAMSEI